MTAEHHNSSFKDRQRSPFFRSLNGLILFVSGRLSMRREGSLADATGIKVLSCIVSIIGRVGRPLESSDSVSTGIPAN
ncbi:MAG: hypothetical protein ACJAXW_001995 [Candidatus Azotimanducaceae bacterium]|jgi:hypothetical protein